MISKLIAYLDSGPASSAEIQLALFGRPTPKFQSTLDGMLMFGSLQTVATEKGAVRYSLPNWTPKPFAVTNPDLPSPAPKYNLEETILAVIGRDAPSTARILHRATCYLHLRPFDISFKELRDKLYEMEDNKQIFFMQPTETTDGGWYTARKQTEKKHGQQRRTAPGALQPACQEAPDAGADPGGEEDGQGDGT